LTPVNLLKGLGHGSLLNNQTMGFYIPEVTAEIGLVRFHGRNREAWEKRGLTPVERFNYLYCGRQPSRSGGMKIAVLTWCSEFHIWLIPE